MNRLQYKRKYNYLYLTRQLCPCVAMNKVGISIGYVLVPVR